MDVGTPPLVFCVLVVRHERVRVASVYLLVGLDCPRGRR